jgi:hypothetical protein
MSSGTAVFAEGNIADIPISGNLFGNDAPFIFMQSYLPRKLIRNLFMLPLLPSMQA